MSARPLSSYIEGFIAARRYAKTSAHVRRVACRRFCDHVGDPAPADLTATMCLDWWASIADVKPATAWAYYQGVRQLLVHLRDIDVMEHDPLRAIRPPKVPRSSPRTLTSDDVAKVLAACRNTRDLCIVTLMLGAGLRSVDVSRLTVEDIDLDNGMMVVHGKGGHRDMVPMSDAVVAAVRAHLDERGATTGPVIMSQRGGRALTATGLQQHINNRILRRAGVRVASRDGRSGHAMRRTFGTVLLENGASIREVQVLLRHQSLATTERYLRRPEAEEMRRVVETGPLAVHPPDPANQKQEEEQP